MDNKNEIKLEHKVMRAELDSILKSEAPKVCKFLDECLSHMLRYLNKKQCPVTDKSSENEEIVERANLVSAKGQEGVKCSLLISADELKCIEINYKPTPRHNNYIYKSKEECSWKLYQISKS